MTRLIEVARGEDVPPGTARAIEVEGPQLALVNVGGTFFALDNECTHGAGPLEAGLLVGERSLQCPWHGAVLDVRTGAALEPPAPRGVAEGG